MTSSIGPSRCPTRSTSVRWCRSVWPPVRTAETRSHGISPTTRTRAKVGWASLRDGNRELRGTLSVPFGPIKYTDRYEAERVDPWEIAVTEDGKATIHLLRWTSQPLPLEDFEFLNVRDAGGSNGQFIRGVLREYNGVTLVTMSLDRAVMPG